MQPLCYHSPSFVLRMNLPYHLVIFFNSKKINIYIQCIKILFLLWEVSAISFFRGEGGDLFFFFSFSVKELFVFFWTRINSAYLSHQFTGGKPGERGWLETTLI